MPRPKEEFKRNPESEETFRERTASAERERPLDAAVGQIETSGLIESKPESGRSFHLGEISVAARASQAAVNAVRKNSVTICRIRIRRFVVYTKPRDERRG